MYKLGSNCIKKLSFLFFLIYRCQIINLPERLLKSGIQFATAKYFKLSGRNSDRLKDDFSDLVRIFTFALANFNFKCL